jgi:hypothetical protein
MRLFVEIRRPHCEITVAHELCVDFSRLMYWRAEENGTEISREMPTIHRDYASSDQEIFNRARFRMALTLRPWVASALMALTVLAGMTLSILSAFLNPLEEIPR